MHCAYYGIGSFDPLFIAESTSLTNKAKSFLIGIGILILFLGISYGLASDELSKELVNDEISQTTVKYVDTGLIITYVLGIITVIAVLFSGIFTAIKKF